MTDATLNHPNLIQGVFRSPSFGKTAKPALKTRFFAERIWWQTALLLLATMPVTLLALSLDDRLHNGIPIWIKPLKFQVSMALHLATFAIIASWFQPPQRKSGWMSALAVVSSLAALVEIALIGGQAARGVGSHFNIGASMDHIIYSVMGVGSLLLILPALIIGIRILFAKPTDRMPNLLKAANGSGLLLSFVLTLIIAGYLSMQGSHWVEAPATDVDGVPIVGWTKRGGDLRVAHFFATHLMQVIPFLGLLSVTYLGRRSRLSWSLVCCGVIGGTALTLGTFFQALAGQPFLG
ncbi:MAG: hypothetical protein AAF950_15210 [Pseudomonadota bacterium]